jgi:hypothetical protein
MASDPRVQVKVTGTVDQASFDRAHLALLDHLYDVCEEHGLGHRCGLSPEVEHEQFLARHRLR